MCFVFAPAVYHHRLIRLFTLPWGQLVDRRVYGYAGRVLECKGRQFHSKVASTSLR